MSALLLLYSLLMISLHVFAFNELADDVNTLAQTNNSSTLFKVSQIMLNLTGVFLVNVMLGITRLTSPSPIIFLALIYGLEILAQFLLTRALLVQHINDNTATQKFSSDPTRGNAKQSLQDTY
ncbi:hypothetical protein BKA69DRAFT_1053424 [Paraphysoderma sedebokerense]|nr:hypothetical protein BKA69DRAFT_1053424 [Paraphysoderma sedebokerense]